MKWYILQLIVMILFLGSCVQSNRNDIKKIVLDWQGKEVVVPQRLNYKILGDDVIGDDLWNSKFRVFVYVDSVGCNICRLHLKEWKELIDFSRRESLDVSFIFVVHSSNFNYFTVDLLLYEFDEPVIYDYENQFYKLNRFPPEPYRTFLLDSQNRVQLIGNPVEIPQLWELYMKAITQNQ